MEVIEIERPSSRVLGKLRKGKPCRICQGEGLKIVIERSRMKPIQRAFRKGKAHTLMLSPMEIEANHSSGSGLFDDIRRGFEDVGRKLKPVAEKVGEALLPVAQDLGEQALDKIADIAPEVGSKALTALALYSGNPALVPIAEKVGRMGGQQLGNLARDEGKKAIQKTRKSATAPSMSSAMVPSGPSGPSGPSASVMEAKDLADFTNEELMGELARRQGGYSTPLDRSGNRQVRDPRVSAVGSGLYAQGRTRGKGLYASSGRGMSLVQGKNILLNQEGRMPDALIPDPYSANFQMAAHLPPAYARIARG